MRVTARHYLITGTVALGALLAAAVLLPHAAKGANQGDPDAKRSIARCFHGTDITGWSAPDPKTIYFRVFASRYYRVDLTRACSALDWPRARLITQVRGGDLICEPVDLDVRASEAPGAIPEPCFVKSLTALSQEEVAALPPRAKP
jgi:hypothetical protein